MKGFVLIGIIIANLFSALITSNTPENAERNPKIVGGKDAKAGKFPWMVALYQYDTFICSAFVVSNTSVLTAAHCIVSKDGGLQNPSSFIGLVGNVNKSASTIRLRFRKLIPHPEYKSSGIGTSNDVAVLRTWKGVPLGHLVQPLCVSRPNTRPERYRTSTAMGWGRKNKKSGGKDKSTDILQYTEYTILPRRLCLVAGGGDVGKLCASAKRSGICGGDSGGPLVHLRKGGTPEAIGISSYILGSCAYGPDFFLKTSAYAPFIEKNVGKNAFCEA